MTSLAVLFPLEDGSDGFEGYLQVNGRHHRIFIQFSTKPSGQRSFSCDPAIYRLLGTYANTIQQRLAQASSLSDFVAELQELCDRALDTVTVSTSSHEALDSGRVTYSSASPYSSTSLSPAHLRSLIQNLDAIGWHRIQLPDISQPSSPTSEQSLSKDQLNLNTFSIFLSDDDGRQHRMHIVVPPTYPLTPPKVEFHIPEEARVNVDQVWMKALGEVSVSSPGGSNPFPSVSPATSATSRALLPSSPLDILFSTCSHSINPSSPPTPSSPPSFPPPPSPSSPLLALVSAHEAAFRRCTPLFRQLDLIDKNCWILSPDITRPSQALGTSTRRIALGIRGASLIVTLSVREPLSPPQCVFLGPEHIVAPLRNRWLHRSIASSTSSNHSTTEAKHSLTDDNCVWYLDHSVLDNLQHVLGVTFPSKPSSAVEDVHSFDCGICYTFADSEPVSSTDTQHADTSKNTVLTSTGPSANCPNPQCGRLYHMSCLAAWANTQIQPRLGSSATFTYCPYCSTPIRLTHDLSYPHLLIPPNR